MNWRRRAAYARASTLNVCSLRSRLKKKTGNLIDSLIGSMTQSLGILFRYVRAKKDEPVHGPCCQSSQRLMLFNLVSPLDISYPVDKFQWNQHLLEFATDHASAAIGPELITSWDVNRVSDFRNNTTVEQGANKLKSLRVQLELQTTLIVVPDCIPMALKSEANER